MNHERVNQDHVDKMIDKCDDTHYGIAQVVHMCMKDKFKYGTDDAWYEFDTHAGVWKHMHKNNNVRLALSAIVSEKYMERAMFWLHKSMQDVEDALQTLYEKRYTAITKIAKKLKNYDFKTSVIKECTCLFLVYE